MDVDAEIRGVLYGLFLLLSLEGAFWAWRISRNRGAPKIALPLTIGLLSQAGMCAGLLAAQALQTWQPDDYFDYVDYIRWGIVMGIGASLTAHYLWRFR